MNKKQNLTPAQRVWAGRRNRWSQWNATRGSMQRPLTWAQAVQQGKEREFLKREGEGD